MANFAVNMNHHIRQILIAAVLLLVCAGSTAAQPPQDKALFRNSFGGGMMLNAGWLFGDIEQLQYEAGGFTTGIGGQVKVGLGEHFRIGSEGYVLSAPRMGNGSYIELGWGGVLADFCWRKGRFIPYLGFTVGGGSRKVFLMFEGSGSDWLPEGKTFFNRQAFMAIAPFAGMEFALTESMHLNFNLQWLNALSSSGRLLPSGPCLQVGFSFTH